MTKRKTFGTRAVAFLSAMLFAMTLLLLFPVGTFRVNAETIEVDAIEAGMNISGTIMLNNKILVKDDEVQNGDNLSLDVTWTLPDYTEIKDRVFVYDLSDKLHGITLSDITISVSEAKYVVNGNKLYITVLTNYNQDISGYCGLKGTVNVDALDDNNQYNLQFIDTVVPVFVTDLIPKLNVYKSAGTVTYDGGKYYQEFTVTVQSERQTAHNVTVSDIGDNGLDFSNIKNLTVKYGDGTPVACTPSTSNSGFSVTLPDVGTNWNDKVEIKYSVPVNVDGILDGTADKNNTVTASADKLDTVTATASATASKPSISKSGEYKDGKINWTITVNTGSYNLLDPEFTVTDIPGLNLDSADVAAALGGDLVLNKSDFTSNGNGYYTYTYPTTPDAASQLTDTTYTNSATAKFTGITGTPEYTSNEASVTVYKTYTDFVDKTYGVMDGDRKLPWYIKVEMPDALADEVTVDDYFSSGDNVTMYYDRFKINGTYTLAENETAYNNSKKPTDIGYFIWEGRKFTIVDSTFLNSVYTNGEDITIGYDVDVPSDTLKLTNYVNVSINVNGQYFSDDDTEIYTCDVAQKYLTTSQYFPEASNYEFPVVWGIRVMASEPLAVGDKITVVDTLPKGFEYVSCRVGAWGDDGYSTIPQDCITATVSGNSTDGYKVTFVLTVTQELIDEDKASTWDTCPARIVYLTHADSEHDNLYLNGEQTYTNKATVKKNDTNIGEVSCDVTLTPDDTKVVTKDCVTTPASGDESAYATYTIKINPNKDNLSPGDTLTATDKLGTRLVLDESSINITPSAPYDVNGQVITFTLDDETFYEITYNASFVAISTEDPYTKEQEEAMFGNSISVGDSGITSFSTSTIVGEYEVYGGVTSEQALASITISGTKSWNDTLNKGARPKEIVIKITKKSTFADSSKKEEELTFKVNSNTIDANGNWTYEIKDLPTLTNKGTKITYDVKEVTIDGYKDVKYSSSTTGLTNSTDSVTHKLNIVNTFTAADDEIGDLTVTKVWVGDSASVRPAIKIVLSDDSADTADIEKELTGTSVTFENLQLYNYSRDTAGNLIRTPRKYKLSEVVVNTADQNKLTNYVLTKSYAGEWFTLVDDDKSREPLTADVEQTLTNTYGEAVSVSVEKVWDDNDNQDGLRPETITVNLLADSVKVDSVVLNSGNSWKYTFTGLNKFKDGNEIKYTVSENAVTDYTTTITGDAATGFIVTNTHTPEKTEISVEKIWDDQNNQDGLRPETITVNLLADGEKVNSVILNSGNSWKYTFTGLDKCKDGKVIAYTVSEDAVTGYTPAITGDAATEFIVTNTHTPEKTAVSVEKVWDDNYNQDGIRPTEVTVNLLADGEKVKSVVLNSGNSWKYTFTGLDECKDGKVIAYTVSEDAVTGYTPAITGDAATGFIVTNTHTPEKTDISVEKVWDDNENQDGLRPTEITVKLLADGQETGTKVILDENNKWKHTFTELDKYENGNEIKYTVSEDAVTGYISAITGDMTTGFIVTNTHTPEKTDISVKKVWDDDDNRDGVRPASVTIKLLADGAVAETVTLNADNKWKHTFTGLDKFKDGKEIVYAVEENVVTDYTTAITGDAATGFVVTNNHEPVKTSITGEKTWIDDNNAAGKRPGSIKITLFGNGVAAAEKEVTEADGWKYTFDNLLMYENGKPITYTVAENTIYEYTPTYSGYNITNTYTPGKTFINVTKIWDDGNNRDNLRPVEITVNLLANDVVIKTETLNALNNWTYFAGLDKYDSNGNEIKYTVEEVDVPDGYTSVISGDVTTGFVVTNTHTPAITTVAVEKKWADNNNQDGLRPTEVTVNLLADGFDTGISAVLNDANGWKYTFTGLDKKNGGFDIVYTVEEAAVPSGYTASITGDAASGFVITNTHTPELISISGEKFWVGDKANNRPESITVKLLADGKEVQSMTVSSTDNWQYTFANLPKNSNGTEIVYTVDEVTVDGYNKSINGFNITNTYGDTSTPSVDEKISVKVTKKWVDNNNSAGLRPNDLEITLYQNGAIYATMKSDWVKNGDIWTYTFDNLPKYLPGTTTEYTYDIAEENLTRLNYTGTMVRSEYNFTLTNTHQTPVTIIRPNQKPIPPEDVSSESSITVESDMLDVNNTASYSLIAILLAITAGGIVIARRRQK